MSSDTIFLLHTQPAESERRERESERESARARVCAGSVAMLFLDTLNGLHTLHTFRIAVRSPVLLV